MSAAAYGQTGARGATFDKTFGSKYMALAAVSEPNGQRSLWAKLITALIPIGLAALVTVAWQNSQTLALLKASEADLRGDMARLEHELQGCQR